MADSTDLLITGATGKVGGALLRHLIELGHSGRIAVGVRNPSQAALSVEARPFDFSDPSTFSPAFVGIKKVFLINFGTPEEMRAVVDSALAAGVQHITMLSGRTTGGIPGSDHRLLETYLEENAPSFTVLRPGWFMQNFLFWIGDLMRTQRSFFLPAGDSKTAFVDVRDIAEVAAVTLVESGHSGRTYELVEEQAYSHADLATLISHAIGQQVAYHAVSEDDYRQRATAIGHSTGRIDGTLGLYRLVAEGREEATSTLIRQLLDREPRTLPGFVREHAHVWK